MSQKIKECIHCSESFEATRKNHIYCSKSCIVMACVKRKGYTYFSGRYVKSVSDQQGSFGSPATVDSALSAPPAGGMPMPAPLGERMIVPRGAEEITLAGIAENAIGSGIVAMSKHYFVDRHNEKTLQEIHAMLQRLLRLQQPQRMGQEMEPSPKKHIRNTPHEQTVKQLGKIAPSNPGSGMGEEWM